MKKFSIVSLLAILSMCLASCQDKKTSGFDKSDLVGSWEEVTLGIGEPFCLNEDGTGTSEGFLRTHFLNWDLRNDSLFIAFYYDGRLQKMDVYAIDSLNEEQHDGNKYRVMCLSRIERVYRGYCSMSLVDHQDVLDFMIRWLKTDSGREWLADRNENGMRQWGEYANDWLYSEVGQAWLNTDDGQAWLQTEVGKEYMRTELRHYQFAQQIK